MTLWTPEQYTTLKDWLTATYTGDRPTVVEAVAATKVVVPAGYTSPLSKTVRAWALEFGLWEVLHAAAVDQSMPQLVRDTLQVAIADLASEATVFDFSNSSQLAGLQACVSSIDEFTTTARDSLLALAATTTTVGAAAGLRSPTAGRMRRAFLELGWDI